MTFRDSLNNLIRGDRPESPTDVIFLFGSLILINLQVYATIANTTVPHFSEMLLALGGFKSVKVASNWSKKSTSTGNQVDEAVGGAGQ